MAEGIKISQLPLAAELTGEERLPFALEGDNGAATTALLKEHAQQGMVAAVDGKGLSTNDYSTADKDKLAALPTNEQFGLSGYYHKTTGVLTAGATFVNSGLLPLNREEDIVYFGSSSGNAASVSFFDATGALVSSVQHTGAAAEHVIAKADFPEAAVYFAVTCLASVDNRRYSNGTTVESREGATAEAIERSKKVLFVDLWTNLSTPVLKYKYYPETDTFGAECSTDLNEEITIEGSKYILKDMTYEQALYAYLHRTNVVLPTACIKGRMNIIPNGYQYGSGPTFNILGSAQAVYENTNEVIILTAPAINCVTDKNLTINNCNNTKAIIGKIRCSVENNPIQFSYADTAVPMLEYMTPKIKVNFAIRWFSKLTLFTMKYIVENAANTSAITITVHPDVYAKLTGDIDNEAAAALSAEELAQWAALVGQAAAKQIQFVTTE